MRPSQQTRRPLELWAGVECSRNRVGDRVHDQLERTGHAGRATDLDLIAGLGVRAVRYPVLWERVAPDGLDAADWTWPDERLGRLRELGIRPIVGLLHHGNGPRGTNLLDPGFPEKFAAYARAVAERYPWVDAYLPVNEPLTTARFCGLYGIWFPHRSDPESFTRILLNQLQATRLAIRVIREVNPDAHIIQGEDVGTVGSTPLLAERAAYENERRWLTFDLLCGTLDEASAMWPRLLSWGADVAELRSFVEEPSPPDIIGVDHYITSDRLLDERLERYPSWAHGGEREARWADVEAVRATAEEPAGVLTALREAWARYRRPLAITESHLGSTREEQVRWLQEGWDAARTVADEGADVRALTVWMLFGGYDWNSLVTAENGFYEPGAFDLRGGAPRPTAIARWISEIAHHGRSESPVLGDDPWWRRQERLTYPAVEVGGAPSRPRSEVRPRRPLLILGPEGPVRTEFQRACDVRGFKAIPVDSHEDHGTDLLARLSGPEAPWGVVDASWHGAPCARCDAFSFGAAAGGFGAGAALLLVSSYRAFAGRADEPYVESDTCDGDPSIVAREHLVSSWHPQALVARTGPMFGVNLKPLHPGDGFHGVVSPTYVSDAVTEALDLLVDGESGRWHIANVGAVEWDSPLDLVAGRDTEVGGSGVRLRSERGSVLPPLRDAVRRCVTEPEHRGFPSIPDAWLELAEAELAGTTAPAFSAPAHVPTSTRTAPTEETGS